MTISRIVAAASTLALNTDRGALAVTTLLFLSMQRLVVDALTDGAVKG